MNRNTPKFTACLLAGGKSSRMGRDKALIELNGVLLWRHQVSLLQQTGAAEILVSGRRDLPGEAGGEIRFISDEAAGRGPLSGVHAALGAALHPLVLVLAIDTPMMTSLYLRELIARAFETDRGVVPQRDGCYEPLASVYPVRARKIAVTALHGQDFSMQYFVGECVRQNLVDPLAIFDSDAELFRNLNTAGDLMGIS